MNALQPVAVEVADRDPWPLYVEAWLAAHATRPHTARAYRVDERQWRAWCAGTGVHPLSAVRAHVDTWRNHLAEHGGPNGRPAAPKTIARKLAAVASLYEHLIDEGILDHSPTERVSRPTVSKDYAATVSLDEGQLRAVLAAVRDDGGAVQAAVVVLALTGARASEVLGADVTDLVEDHGHHCLDVHRKGGAMDRLVLPPSAAHVLTTYLAGRRAGPLLVTATGERLTYDALLWALRKAGRRAGLPVALRLHPHMLRASFATISFDHGVPGDRIQDALGHADPRTTRLYDRGRRRLRRKAEPGAVVARYVMPDE